jgi:DNA-binding NarL/FixJ family response regulator
MSADIIRIVLADDHAVVRTGLRALLEKAPDMTVVGEASNGREAVELAARLNPEVVIMDLTMDQMDGSEATAEIVKLPPPSHARVLVLTMHEENEYLLPALEAGAAGYLVKSTAPRDLVNAVRLVARGDVFVRPAAAAPLAKRLARKQPEMEERERFNKLSERERSVLRFVAQGYSAPEIGDRLVISSKTVDTYKQRIHEKMGISHRAEYVQTALRLGLLGK